jgi:hypothetical protein
LGHLPRQRIGPRGSDEPVGGRDFVQLPRK